MYSGKIYMKSKRRKYQLAESGEPSAKSKEWSVSESVVDDTQPISFPDPAMLCGYAQRETLE